MKYWQPDKQRCGNNNELFKSHLVFLIALCFILLTSVHLKGESWQHFNSDNSDLPSDTVLSLAIDGYGAKWIGTSGGLAHFDGSNWTVYTTTNSGLPSNTVRCLAISNDGNIWIGTNSGLAIYDGTGREITERNWTVYNMNNSPLPLNVVSSLAIDSNGIVWIGTLGGGGVASFDGSSWNVYNTGNSDLPNNFIYALYADAENSVWIGTNYGLAKLTGTAWTVYHTGNSELPDNSIRSISGSNDNKLYFGTLNGGIAVLEDTGWTVFNQQNSPLPDNHISSVSIETGGIIWLGTENDGLVRRNNTVWSVYDESNSDLPDNNVNIVIVEDEQRKWIGTEGGLVSYDFVSVTGIDVEPDNLVLQPGMTYQLSAAVYPGNADNQDYYWYSGNESLAIVNETGLVTALTSGMVTVFAGSSDGNYSAGCFINITGTVSEPVFIPAAGEFNEPQQITILIETEDAEIRYTLDGSEPDESSPEYTEPLLIEKSTVISARGFKEHWIPSPVVTAEYVIHTSADDDIEFPAPGLSCSFYPNPLFINKTQRSSLTIGFQIYLPAKADTKLRIFDIKGRKVREEQREQLPAGLHDKVINLSSGSEQEISSGIYFYHFQAGKEIVTGRFTIIR